MSRVKLVPIKLLNAKAANGAGSYVDVSDFKNLTVTVYTSGSTTATIKFAVSNELTVPAFGSAASVTNVYDYVQITPLNSQLVADKLSGSTGIALSGTDVIKMYSIDSSNIKWLCPIVSGYSGSGVITVEITGVSDDSR